MARSIHRPLFLYQKPFSIVSPTSEQSEMYHTFDEQDTSECETIWSILLAFAKANKMISVDPTVSVIGDKQGGSWIHLTQYMNFMQLQTESGLSAVEQAIDDQGILKPTTLLLECYVRLGMTCDELTLSKLITRTYHTLGNIPCADDGRDPDSILLDVHTQYPFLWILPATQAIIYNTIALAGRSL